MLNCTKIHNYTQFFESCRWKEKNLQVINVSIFNLREEYAILFHLTFTTALLAYDLYVIKIIVKNGKVLHFLTKL